MLAALTRTYHTWVIVELPWWVELTLVLAALALLVSVIVRIRRHLAHGKPPPLPPADRTP
jgi:hypothetical protein